MTPIIKTTHVPLSPQDAFDLFMADLDYWWPKDRHATDKNATLEVEAHKNGAITEVLPNGTRNLWGRIIGWEPGHYMAFTWHPDGPEEEATVVAVSFKRISDGTQVDLTHGGFEVLGETADAISTTYLLGWDLVLGSYCYAATKVRVDA